MGFPEGSGIKNLPVSAGDARDLVLISGSGRSRGGGDGNPPQYFCLESSTSLEGYSPGAHKESDTTEHEYMYTSIMQQSKILLQFILACINALFLIFFHNLIILRLDQRRLGAMGSNIR